MYDLERFVLQQNIVVDSIGISFMCAINNQVSDRPLFALYDANVRICFFKTSQFSLITMFFKLQVWIGNKEGKLQVLDAGDYSRIQTLDGHYDVIRCMTAALDRYVITGSSSKDGSIMVWSLIPETV